MSYVKASFKFYDTETTSELIFRNENVVMFPVETWQHENSQMANTSGQ
jgi:hypothetical protein